ncbi:hypothetical protein [Flavobacterium sp. 3HN19-14]|uniref:hypothetical protein n=1 Tax=Flavobacterium sp. 3HN19-14 TaxID=3448133 RepID=UPI003EE312DE
MIIHVYSVFPSQRSLALSAGLLKPNEHDLLPLLPHESYDPNVDINQACGGQALKRCGTHISIGCPHSFLEQLTRQFPRAEPFVFAERTETFCLNWHSATSLPCATVIARIFLLLGVAI